MAKRTLKVYANPWLHVDHEGRPCCTVELEEFSGRWVGARPTITASGEALTVGGLTGYLGGDATHDVVWDFDSAPQEVPDTGYYRDRIREGALILVDASDAAKLGIQRWVVGGKREFVPGGKGALAKPLGETAQSPQPTRAAKGQESS